MGPKIHPTLQNYAGYCLSKAAMRGRSLVDSELKAYGVVAPQYGILSMLANVGSMTQVELGGYMAIDKATMVRMLDGLEELGYLKRVAQAEDRRSKKLVLTKKGETTLVKMSAARNRAEEAFFGILTDKEREALRAITRKLLQIGD